MRLNDAATSRSLDLDQLFPTCLLDMDLLSSFPAPLRHHNEKYLAYCEEYALYLLEHLYVYGVYSFVDGRIWSMRRIQREVALYIWGNTSGCEPPLDIRRFLLFFATVLCCHVIPHCRGCVIHA